MQWSTFEIASVAVAAPLFAFALLAVLWSKRRPMTRRASLLDRYRGKIFVAYRRDGDDILFARNVKFELERVYGRRSVFFDDESMERGVAWEAAILQEFDRRAKPWVVYCVGPSWAPSPGVRFEVEQVVERGLASTLVLDSEKSHERALELTDKNEVKRHPELEVTANWLHGSVTNYVSAKRLGDELRGHIVDGNLRRVWPRRRRRIANGVLGGFMIAAGLLATWLSASALLPVDPNCEIAAACELSQALGPSWLIVDELSDPVPPFDDVCEGYSVAGVSRSVDFLSDDAEGAIAVQRVDLGSPTNVQARWAELQTRVRECVGEVEMNGSVLRLTVVQQLLPHQRSFWVDGSALVGVAYRSYTDRLSEAVSGKIDALAGELS